METQTPAFATSVMKQSLASSYMPMDFWFDKFGTPLYICNVFQRNDMMLFDLAFLRPFSSATLAMVDCFRSCFCLRRSFHSWLTSLFVIVRYFARCFLRCPRCHDCDAASVVRCRFFASCRKHFAHFAISDEILRPHRVCDLCEEFFAGETFFSSSKKKVSCKALYHGVFSNRLNIFILLVRISRKIN